MIAYPPPVKLSASARLHRWASDEGRPVVPPSLAIIKGIQEAPPLLTIAPGDGDDATASNNQSLAKVSQGTATHTSPLPGNEARKVRCQGHKGEKEAPPDSGTRGSDVGCSHRIQRDGTHPYYAHEHSTHPASHRS